MKNQELYGKMALFMAAFLWGVSFIAVEKAMDFGWTPFNLLGMRGLLAGSALMIFAYRRKFWLNGKLLFESALAGFIMFFGMALQTYGQALSTVSNSSFITVLYVVFIPIMLWKVQKPSFSVILAICFGVMGTGFLTLQEGLSLRLGDILLVGSAWMFALHIIFLGRLARFNDAMSVSVIQSYTMSLFGFILSFFLNQSIPSGGYIYVAYAGFMSSGLAFLLQLYGQKHVKPTAAGLFLTMEALFGSLGAIILLNEPFTINIFIGGSLMVLAVVTIELGPKLFPRIKGG